LVPATSNMQSTKLDSLDDSGEEFRRSVHDVSAAIIYVRALAENLAKHLPTLVAISRSKFPEIGTQIPLRELDALPSIPSEIIELCEIASGVLREMSCGDGANGKNDLPETGGLPAGRPASRPERTNGKGATILLVEDEEMARYLLSQTLETKGFRVTGASDGKDALRLLDEQDFDLILMDLRIPGMSGCETAKRIRQRDSEQGRFTRIVGLTASPLLEDQRRAKAAGMDGVLVKPIDDTALQTVLRSIK